MKKFTLFTIVALLAVALIVPQVMAASKATPYGRMWFDTFSVDWDKNSGVGNAANANFIGIINGAYNPNFDEQDLIWENISYTMMGINFKADCFTAKFEINNGGGAANAIDIRHSYGSYNFGAGSVLVGHTWDIGYLSCIPAKNADGAQVPWVHKGGTPPTQAREAQIRLSFPTAFGHFMFAAQTPQTTAVDTNATAAQIDAVSVVATTTPRDYETSIPALRARWTTKPIGPVMFILFAGYNTYEAVYNPTVATQEMRYDIDSTVVSALAIANFGPIGAKLLIGKSKNAENYSTDVNPVYNWGSYLYRNPTTGAYSQHDSEVFTWQAELTYKATKNINLIFIYGEDEESLDIPGTNWEWDTSAWGVIVPITVCPGFEIIPQYQKVDLGTRNTNGIDGAVDAGDATMVGIQWRFTF